MNPILRSYLNTVDRVGKGISQNVLRVEEIDPRQVNRSFDSLPCIFKHTFYALLLHHWWKNPCNGCLLAMLFDVLDKLFGFVLVDLYLV
nr:hypothetical protein [Photorhabdus luminescens]